MELRFSPLTVKMLKKNTQDRPKGKFPNHMLKLKANLVLAQLRMSLKGSQTSIRSSKKNLSIKISLSKLEIWVSFKVK